jgi:putative Holliday junction resolvase
LRVIAIDYGDARTGVAVSDLTGLIAGDAFTIFEKSAKNAAAAVAREAQNRGAEIIVLGLPKNMDGSEGARAAKSRELKALIEELCEIPVKLWDERLSTVQAHAVLRGVGKKEKKHKNVVDAVAASLILESYLGSDNPKRL